MLGDTLTKERNALKQTGTVSAENERLIGQVKGLKQQISACMFNTPQIVFLISLLPDQGTPEHIQETFVNLSRNFDECKLAVLFEGV